MDLLGKTTRRMHSVIDYTVHQWEEENAEKLSAHVEYMGTGEVSCTGRAVSCTVQGRLDVGDGSVVYDCVVAEGTTVKIGRNCHVRGCKFYGDTVVGDDCVVAGVFVECTAEVILGAGAAVIGGTIKGAGGVKSVSSVYIGDRTILSSTSLRLRGGFSIGSDGLLVCIGLEASATNGTVLGRRFFAAVSGFKMYDLEASVNAALTDITGIHTAYRLAFMTLSSRSGAIRTGDDCRFLSHALYIRAYGNVMIGDRVRISDSASACGGIHTVLAYRSIRVGSDVNMIRNGGILYPHSYRPDATSRDLRVGSRATVVFGLSPATEDGLEIKEGDVVAV